MTHETINTILAALALLVSIIAIYRTSSDSKTSNEIGAKNLEIASQALRLTQAQVEIDVRARITQATRDLHEFGNKYGAILARAQADPASLSPAEKEEEALAKKNGGSVEAEFLNAYDEACQKYLDDKLDKKRFKKTYVNYVREICEDKGYSETINRGHRYAAIRTVFNEWENHEKD